MPITSAFIFLVVLVLVFSFSIFGFMTYKNWAREPAYITSIVDGDTVWGKTERNGDLNVRPPGIDTPETKHPTKGVEFYGPEATEYAKKKLYHKNVVFDYRVTPNFKGRTPKSEKYQRALAYIYVDGRDYGFWAIWDGYAREENYGHKHPKQRLYELAELSAKIRGVGIWQR